MKDRRGNSNDVVDMVQIGWKDGEPPDCCCIWDGCLPDSDGYCKDCDMKCQTLD